jgi:Ca2+-binding RTX toxin-like protein
VTPFPPSFRSQVPFGEVIHCTDVATAVVVQDDGGIVLVGYDDVETQTEDPFTHSVDWGLIRYEPDGSLDETFGDGGRLTTSFGDADSPAAALITPDGKLLVAGAGEPAATGGDFALARYFLTAPHPIRATVVGGVLKVTGTDVGDTIRMRTSGGALKIDGLAGTFATASFSRVEIDARGGDDRVDASTLGVPVRVDAGAGGDVVLGGAGADALLGNAGDDTLFGGRGADTLRGGGGNDHLNAGPGEDFLYGDDGKDQFFSVDTSLVRIEGGAGFDRLKSVFDDLASNVERSLA